MRRDLLIRQAQSGNDVAQEELGSKLWDGYFGRHEWKKAVEWFRKSAEKGNSVARYKLFLAYFEGKGVSKDSVKAFEWAKKATESQWPWPAIEGLVFMGWCYDHGVGIDKNKEKAKECYQRAAEIGNQVAACNLGLLYEEEGDYTSAAHWYWVGSARNWSQACYQLGRLYLYGKGVQKNPQLAKRYLDRAQRQGNTSARRLLQSKVFKNAIKKHYSSSSYSPPFKYWRGQWQDIDPLSPTWDYHTWVCKIGGETPTEVTLKIKSLHDKNLERTEKVFFKEGRLVAFMKVPDIKPPVIHIYTLISKKRMLLTSNKTSRIFFQDKISDDDAA